MNKWLLHTAVFGFAAVMALGAVACGGDDDDEDDDNPTAAATAATADDGDDVSDEEQEVEDAVQAAFDTWNAKDVPGLVAKFTDAGLVATLGEDGGTAAEVEAGLPEFIGEQQIADAEFSNTSVDGDAASTDVQYAVGRTLEAESYELIKQGEIWLIDGQEDGEVEVPDGTTEVNVDLNEFAFGLRTTDITDATGPVALVGNNVGEQDHEIGLAKIPADANIDELLMTEEDVPGFEFIGGAGPIEPGETDTMVLTAPLEPGRYLMVCFLPNTDEGEEGTPHVFLGMQKELIVD